NNLVRQVVASLARTLVLSYQFARTLSGSLLIDCCVVMKVTAQVEIKVHLFTEFCHSADFAG
ncbi:hypothetical protein PSYMO_04688, partial [Pseudomonas amygdali pv. mori str. 301020]